MSDEELILNIDEIMNADDRDSDGYISYAEFMIYIRRRKEEVTQQRVISPTLCEVTWLASLEGIDSRPAHAAIYSNE